MNCAALRLLNLAQPAPELPPWLDVFFCVTCGAVNDVTTWLAVWWRPTHYMCSHCRTAQIPYPVFRIPP
jgi:hypothetical protein